MTASRIMAVTLAAAFALPLSAGAAAVSWMSIDAANKSVDFQIAMGAPGEGSGLNFNGYAHGHLTITVPVGWKVSMQVANDDSLPHSMEIVDAQATPPMEAVATAFPRAETLNLTSGLPPNQGDSLSFVADKPGRYWIMCGVPGHAAGGMWDWLVVSDSVKTPTVEITKPQ